MPGAQPPLVFSWKIECLMKICVASLFLRNVCVFLLVPHFFFCTLRLAPFTVQHQLTTNSTSTSEVVCAFLWNATVMSDIPTTNSSLRDLYRAFAPLRQSNNPLQKYFLDKNSHLFDNGGSHSGHRNCKYPTMYSVPENNLFAFALTQSQYVQQQQIDLLLMGAYGQRRIRHLIIGSTTLQLLRSSQIAVLLFR